MVAATSLCLLGGIYLFVPRFLLRSYERLEQETLERNLDRTLLALEQVTQDLHEKSSDWAFWDDAYTFLGDRNTRFIKANLQAESLKNLRLDVILFADTRGRLFYAKTIPRVPGLAPPDSGRLIRNLELTAFAQKKQNDKEFYGVLIENATPLLVTARPILKSDRSGPPRGWCVFARYLDVAEVQSLAKRTRLDVSLIALTNPDADTAAILGQLQARQTTHTLLPSHHVAGYRLLYDTKHQPIRIVRIVQPRSIYQHGVQSVRYLMRLLLLSALAFGGMMLLVLEYFILSRISRLSGQVERIGTQGDTESRVFLPGRDEIARLAEKINVMLQQLAEHARVRASAERLRLHNALLANDVLERTRELEAKNSELKQMNAVLEYAVEGIARMDAAGHYLAVNKAFADILGYAPESLIGMHWLEHSVPSERARLERAWEEMLLNGKVELETRCKHQDGSAFHTAVTLIAAQASEERYCFLKDITERKELEDRISHQAFHDPLTGLPNRAHFLDRVERSLECAVREQRTIGVLFIDLDNFKFINDSMGHEEGDRLLIEVAQRLSESVRSEDLVARLGGDEFTILLESLRQPEDAVMVAERILERMRMPVRLSQQEIFVTPSIGIALSSETCFQRDDLLRDADTAMYEAKANGKAGYVLFDPGMNTHAMERVEMETALRRALENQEFRVYYQALVNLDDGAICGAEALVRWEHPKLGLVSPAKFIPLAEETGLIVPLGAWVLEEACLQAKRWREEGGERSFVISVNLSARQLQQQDIVNQIAGTLERTGLNPHCLKLEITESLMLVDTEGIIQKMHALKAMGIQLAMDDFGTGYSSLSYLQRLPLDTVKIDRSLVTHVGSDVKTAAIVLSVIRMCRALNLSVICEGIETAEQVAQLQALGCDQAQGYFFSRPVAQEDFATLWKQGRLGPEIAASCETWAQQDFIYLAA